MDFFDTCIFNVLRDGTSRGFNQLLREVDFSHNTLRLNLRRLVDQGLVVKEKTPSKGLGRPIFIYSTPPKLHRQASRLLRPLQWNCHSPFPEVKAPLQIREGRILQESQEEMRSPKLPPNPKKGIKTILHQFLNTLARYIPWVSRHSRWCHLCCQRLRA